MLTQHEITLNEHLAWFERVSKNPAVDLLVFEQGDQCSGFVQFKETSNQGVSDWGFYVSPDAPKGTGRRLGTAALEYAFQNEKLHKICGQALHFNLPSIAFHKSLAFVEEGVLREHHFDGECYHDLVCFGLLKREWMARE